MKYFLHDSNAFNDAKITELFINFGYEGLGLFYTILEKLASQEKPIKTVVLKKQLKVGKKLERCWKFMEDIGLISSTNGETFNKQLLKYSEKYKEKREKTSKRVENFRAKEPEKQQVEQNSNALHERYNSIGNASKDIVSNSIVESSIIKIDRVPVFQELPPTTKGNEFETLKTKIDEWFNSGHNKIELFTSQVRFRGNFQDEVINFCSWHAIHKPAYAKLPIDQLLNHLRKWITNPMAKEIAKKSEPEKQVYKPAKNYNPRA